MPPPAAPDPMETARAQSRGNIGAALATSRMNMFDTEGRTAPPPSPDG